MSFFHKLFKGLTDDKPKDNSVCSKPTVFFYLLLFTCDVVSVLGFEVIIIIVYVDVL